MYRRLSSLRWLTRQVPYLSSLRPLTGTYRRLSSLRPLNLVKIRKRVQGITELTRLVADWTVYAQQEGQEAPARISRAYRTGAQTGQSTLPFLEMLIEQ